MIEIFYLFRKFDIYPLSFNHETSADNLVVAAPYGGSIAITRNPKKFVKIQGSAKTLISFYSSSGNLMANMHVCILFFHLMQS